MPLDVGELPIVAVEGADLYPFLGGQGRKVAIGEVHISGGIAHQGVLKNEPLMTVHGPVRQEITQRMGRRSAVDVEVILHNIEHLGDDDGGDDDTHTTRLGTRQKGPATLKLMSLAWEQSPGDDIRVDVQPTHSAGGFEVSTDRGRPHDGADLLLRRHLGLAAKATDDGGHRAALGPQHDLTLFNHKGDALARAELEILANLARDSRLALSSKGRGLFHTTRLWGLDL